jgi:hypothetical protein
MAFKAPPSILQRVLRFKAIKHEQGGRLTLWGIPANLWPSYSMVYLQRLMEKDLGSRKTSSILYAMGKFQSIQTFRMVSKRFGYAKTIPDKAKLLKFNTGQAEMGGLGTGEWVRLDFEKGIFILRGRSTFAEEYKRFFGIQSHHVDYFIRGCLEAYIDAVSENKKMFCIETSCIATGKNYCEYIVREKGDFKRDEIAGQEVDELTTDIRKLGAKIEPYIALIRNS